MNRSLRSFLPSLALLCVAGSVPLAAQQEQAVSIPFAAEGGPAWQAVGQGASVDGDADRLTVSYPRAGRAAFGTAVKVSSRFFAGLSALEIGFGSGGKGSTVLISLRNEAGGVHSWSPVRLDGTPKTVRLDPAQLRADAFQNNGRDPGPFDASSVVILSLTDIGGFFGAKNENATWSLTSVRAELGAAAEEAVTEGDARIRPTSAGAQLFVRALVHGEGAPDAALSLLIAEAMQRPDDPSAYLWLGLNQLWLAAEGNRRNPRTLEHALLADRWFDRFYRVGGTDPRVPSWSVPTKLTLNNALGIAPRSEEGRSEEGRGEDLMAPLREAYRKDPAFHGFSIGLAGFSSPVESKSFQRGLAALRQAFEADDSDESVQNRPNWPHNIEGFLLFTADYEHRAGNAKKALSLLERIEQVEEFPSWPYRAEVERRRKAWAEGELIDHSGGWMQRRSCTICHRK